MSKTSTNTTSTSGHRGRVDGRAAALMARRRLPVTVISGFLGAGKTTLVRRLIRDLAPQRVAVIVNDLSELPVDADLVRETREGHDELVVNLHRGSLGGTLREAFRGALDAMVADEQLAHCLIETSGGTHPDRLVADLTARDDIVFDGFVTVVDGLNLLRDFDGGRALLAPSAPDDLRALLTAQVVAASVLIVSKADRLRRAEAESILRVLRQLNARAVIITAAYGHVDPKRIVGLGGVGQRRRITGHVTAEDEPARFDLGSEVLLDPRPFHPQRLHALFTQALPVGIHRSKGWLWLASRPLDVLVWSQAGSYLGLEWAGTWKAGVLADPDARLRPEERQALAVHVQSVHRVFGDRHCEMTFIGHANARAAFRTQLEACLCTDREIDAWTQGASFDDPWPTRIRSI
ncbi:MAG: GTP-binding protein [Betaproteobacteria bacterium]|nr:GTP-binding protein [Betaproteobacteria bacterium]